MKAPPKVRAQTFWWVLGMLWGQQGVGYLISLVIYGKHPFLEGSTAMCFLGLALFQLIYSFYRVMIYGDGEIGVLIPLWAYPYWAWQKKVKRDLQAIQEEASVQATPDRDPLEDEIMNAAQLAGIVPKEVERPDILKVPVSKRPVAKKPCA